METVKTTNDYKILKRRDGRYAVKNKAGKWVNGVEKVKILSTEDLIKFSTPKKAEEPPAEAAAEETPAAETPAE